MQLNLEKCHQARVYFFHTHFRQKKKENGVVMIMSNNCPKSVLLMLCNQRFGRNYVLFVRSFLLDLWWSVDMTKSELSFPTFL